MDFHYSRWACFWAIRQLINCRINARTDVSSLLTAGSLRDRCPSFCWQAPVLPGLRVRILLLVRVPLIQSALFHSQVNLENGGADQPSASDFTTFPGMYNGFKWPDIYTDNLDGFVVAGPNLVSFADGPSDPASSPSPSSSVYPNSNRPSSTTSPANPTSTRTCRTRNSKPKKRSLSFRHIRRRSFNR